MEPVIIDAEAVEVVIPTEEVVITEEVVETPSEGVVNENVCTSCEG